MTWVGFSPPLAITKSLETDLHIEVSPQPLTDQSQISFQLENTQALTIELYDLKGSLVQTISQDQYPAGLNKVTLAGLSLPSGTFILKISGDLGEYASRVLNLKF